MIKLYFTFILFILTINSFSQDIKIVNTQELNIRSGAGVKYEVIGKVKEGVEVTVISEIADWSEIKTPNGTIGFVSSKLLTSKSNFNSTKNKKDSNWVSYLIGIIALLYGINKIMKWFSSTFSNSSKKPVKNKTNKNSNTIIIENQIANIETNGGNTLKLFNEQGKEFKSIILFSTENFVGFTPTFFVTISKYNVATLYGIDGKKISSKILFKNENFNNCSGNSFTTIMDNKFITTYDKKCQKISSRIKS